LNSPLPDYSISQIALNNNIAYIATKENGFTKYSGNLQWQLYNVNNSNIAENNLTCVSTGFNNTIWIGTQQQGLLLFDNNFTSAAVEENNGISIYPNPTSDYVRIYNLNAANNIENIYLHNINGQLINSINSFNYHIVEIDFSNYPQGFYYVIVQFPNGSSSLQKVIKY
jgi:hypothetical protein